MKTPLAVLALLLSPLAAHAGFTTNQSAASLLGQPDFISTNPGSQTTVTVKSL